MEETTQSWDMPVGAALPKPASSLRNPPVRKILEQRIAEYEQWIQIHRDALKALDENPGIENVLNMMRKIGI